MFRIFSSPRNKFPALFTSTFSLFKPYHSISVAHFSSTKEKGFKKSSSPHSKSNKNRDFFTQNQPQALSKSAAVSPYGKTSTNKSKIKEQKDNKPQPSKIEKRKPVNISGLPIVQPEEDPMESRVKKLKEEISLKYNEPPGNNLSKEEEEAENFKLDVPWDFKNKVIKPKEGNLKAPLSMGKLLSYPVAVGLFKDYVQALKDYDIERLQELLEPVFWERCSKNLEKMKKREYKFKVEGMSSKNNKIDIRQVTNLFCIGVDWDRRKNDGENHFHIL